MPTDTAVRVTRLWPTQIWLGQLELGVRAPITADLLTDTGYLDVDPASVISDPAQAEALIVQTARQVAGLGELPRVELAVQRLGAGFSIGLEYPVSDWFGWCALAMTTTEPDSVSGTLSLHDPRAGCAAVGVPGLPWGRPLTVKPSPGLAVVHPGWLGYSMTPIDAGHTVLMLTVAISRDSAVPS